jgi:hypothetical protein
MKSVKDRHTLQRILSYFVKGLSFRLRTDFMQKVNCQITKTKNYAPR